MNTSMDFVARFKHEQPWEKGFTIFWMGQAGFIIKTGKGEVIGIDLYFSDLVEKQLGIEFKRIMPTLIGPADIKYNYLLISHDHPDHLDMDSITGMISQGTRVLASIEAYKKLEGIHGFRESDFIRCIPGDRHEFTNFSITITPADHGELAYDAVGFIIDINGSRIYFAGDTAFSPDVLSDVTAARPEISLLPINGEFGNLSPLEAIAYAKELKTKVMIPCHFWTFPAHKGSPLELLRSAGSGNLEIALLSQGEAFRMARFAGK